MRVVLALTNLDGSESKRLPEKKNQTKDVSDDTVHKQTSRRLTEHLMARKSAVDN
jgi:hypothetical protein